MLKYNKSVKKASKMFVRPSNRYYFGSWVGFPHFPVWRKGNTIKIFGKKFQLPIWLSFYKFDYDIFWKTKYDQIIYEHPPFFCIVFFGYCFGIIKEYKEKGEFDDEDQYWETMLYYLHGDKPYDLQYVLDASGEWRKTTKDGEILYFSLQKEFLNPEYHNEYDECLKRYKCIWDD